MKTGTQTRTYKRAECVVFRKTKEAFGGLSNMATGFPLEVNGLHIPTSEALYQACRFPDLPDVQRLIIAQHSPMTAKMKSKPYRQQSRPDWSQVRFKVMRWCLRVKLVQNWQEFGGLLLQTGDLPIVEESPRDDVWGAKPVDDTLSGVNALGRLLMELREEMRQGGRSAFQSVEPPAVPNFLLLEKPIGVVSAQPTQDVPDLTLPSIEVAGPLSEMSERQSTEHRALLSLLRPYIEYKDSGPPWVCNIPFHWKTERAKWLFTKMDRSVHSEDEVVTCFRDGTVTLRKNRRLRGFTEALFESGYQGIRKGDLVIHAMDAFAGAIGVSDSDGKGTPVYVVCQPRSEVNAYYYAYIVREMARSQWILALARGIRERSTDFRFDDFGSQQVPFPPLEEQQAIVRFLDHVNRRIERFIQAKRKLIALLNEQKQAVIHRAVTRGLDPNVPLKPSGIEWLGDIPEHWKMQRLKTLSRFVTSGSRGWARYYSDSGSVFLRIGNISTTSIDLRLGKISYVSPPANAEGQRTRAVKDDILLSITAQIGAVGIVPDGLGEAYVNQHTALIRLLPYLCEPSWVGYCLLSKFGKNQCHLLTNGGTKVGLTLDDVRCLCMLVPPMAEQRQIISEIEKLTQNLNIAIVRTEREIALMHEFRARLVSDVVTGRLDVREAVRALPDEPVGTEETVAEIESDPELSGEEDHE